MESDPSIPPLNSWAPLIELFLPFLSKPCSVPDDLPIDCVRSILQTFVRERYTPSDSKVQLIVKCVNTVQAANDALLYATKESNFELAKSLVKIFGAQTTKPTNEKIPLHFVAQSQAKELFFLDQAVLVRCILGHGDFRRLPKDIRRQFIHLFFYYIAPGYRDSFSIPKEVPESEHAAEIENTFEMFNYTPYFKISSFVSVFLDSFTYISRGTEIQKLPSKSDLRDYYLMSNQKNDYPPCFFWNGTKFHKINSASWTNQYREKSTFLCGISLFRNEKEVLLAEQKHILILFQGCRRIDIFVSQDSVIYSAFSNLMCGLLSRTQQWVYDNAPVAEPLLPEETEEKLRSLLF